MRKDNSTLLKKLKQYSALAAPMIATVGLANAQVVYTDVEPDDTFEALNPFPGDAYGMDLNNDGNFDFAIAVFHGSTYNGIGLFPYPASTGNPNAIEGTLGTFNGYPFGYVGVLELNNNIDNNQEFFQFNQLSTNGTGWYLPVMFTGSSGNPFGNWVGGVVDHYVGFHFSDGTNSYYGWMRCDIPADGSSITVKDYAYNSTPDEGLFAGQGSPLGITSVNNSNEFGIFGFEGVANIIIKDGNYDNATITVVNTMGQKVVDQKATDKLTRIDLNQFGKGLYVVTIQRGSEQFSKKISFR